MAGRCDCARPCNCCSETTDSIALSGSGAPGNCFRFSARYSADAGNIARDGSDGGIFAQPCILGPDGQPLVPDGDNCLPIPAPCILNYNGNPIEPDPDGCIQLPTNGAPPDFGCGLTTDDDTGELMVATSGSYPASDLLGNALTPESAYGKVLCDSDGKLRTLPDHTAVRVQTSGTVFGPTLDPVFGTNQPTSVLDVTLANPSSARQMRTLYIATAYFDGSNGVNQGLLGELQLRLDLGAWSTWSTFRFPEPSTGTIRTGARIAQVYSENLAPGASRFIEVRGNFAKSGGASSQPTSIECSIGLRCFGWTV